MVNTTRPSVSESTFEQLLDATLGAMLGVGKDGRIVLANRQTAILFGYSHKVLIGQLVEELIPDRFKADHPGHRGVYFDKPHSRPMDAVIELYAVRKDGTEFPAEISLSSLHTEDGVLALAAVRDISERGRERERRGAPEPT